MERVMLIHWKEGELPERAARLKKAGFAVETFFSTDGMDVRRIRDNPPDAFIIDLTRLPSHGRAVATFFRQTKATRHSPIIFVGGEPDKIARTRKELPDKVYVSWRGVASAMRKALAKPTDKPIVPGTMAGYSGTPLPKKLGVDGERSVHLIGAPPGFEKLIAAGGDKRIRRNGKSPADVVMLFVKSAADLKRGLPVAKKLLGDGGGIWIAWPKKTSGLQTDLGEAIVRQSGLDTGLVDYKICAIDATWSGLKFARRKR